MRDQWESNVLVICYTWHLGKYFPRLVSSLQSCDTVLAFYIMTAWVAIEGSRNSENQFYTWVASNNLEVTVILLKCMPAKSLCLCLTLCDPMDCSPPGSSVLGILQAGILEWVAMPSSRGSSQPTYWTHISYVSSTGHWQVCSLQLAIWEAPISLTYPSTLNLNVDPCPLLKLNAAQLPLSQIPKMPTVTPKAPLPIRKWNRWDFLMEWNKKLSHG